jgi:WD40 repeat protein
VLRWSIFVCLAVVTGAARGQEHRPWDAVPPVEPTRFGPAPFRFPSSVNTVLVSPDGQWLVARSYSGYRAWNLKTGEPFGPPGLSYYASTAVYSPNPKTLFAAIGGLGLVTLDLDTGDAKPLFVHDPQERVNLIGASRDGRRILTSVGSGNRYNEFSRGRGRVSDLWFAVRDTKTKEFLARVFDAGDSVRTAALSPDGKYLATVGGQGTIKLWDATTGKELRTLLSVPPSPAPPSGRRGGPGGGALASIVLTFSPDSKLLAASGNRGNTSLPMTLWSIPDGVRRTWWDGATGSPATPFAFAPDGRSIFAAGLRDPETVHRYDLATGAAGQVYCGHVGEVRAIAVTPDGQTLITGGYDGTVRVWDVATAVERFPHYGHVGDVSHFAFGPGGRWFASGGADGTVRIRDPATGADLASPLRSGGAGYVDALAADFAGTRLAVGYGRGTVRLWDWATGDVRELPSPESAGTHVHRVAFDPDGRGLSAAFGRGTLVRWALPALTPIPLRTGSTADEAPDLFHLGPTPFSLGIVQKNNTQRYVLRDLVTGKVRSERQFGQLQGLYNPDLTPDGRWLVGTPEWNDRDRIVQFHDTDTLRPRFTLPVVGYGDRSPTRFTPDGRFALYLDDAGKALVIELASGGLVARLESDDLSITSLVMAPDVSRVVGVRSDGLFESFVLRPLPPAGPLADRDLAKCWADLLAVDPKVAFAAVDRLAADPGRAVPFLRDRLRPPEPVTEDEWKKLIQDLDGPRYAARAAAAQRLAEVADRHADDLRTVLKETKSAEVRQAVERILRTSADAKYRPRGEDLRHVRAVYVLEWAGTKEAAELLRAIAAHSSGSVLATEAAVAVLRMR